MKKSPKIPPKFLCDVCDYSTSSTKDFNKHVLTLKHKNRTFLNKKSPKIPLFLVTVAKIIMREIAFGIIRKNAKSVNKKIKKRKSILIWSRSLSSRTRNYRINLLP